MIVDGAELISYMSDVNLTEQQKNQADVILSGVQSELENYCNRPLEMVNITEIVYPDTAGFAYLTVTPVWHVVSIDTLNDGVNSEPDWPTPLERTDDVINLVGTTINENARPIPGGVYVSGFGVAQKISYIGGWNLLANRREYEGVRLAILRVAAREMTGMHDDTLSLRGDNAQKASEPDTRQKGWTYEELRQWDRLRRRIVM